MGGGGGDDEEGVEAGEGPGGGGGGGGGGEEAARVVEEDGEMHVLSAGTTDRSSRKSGKRSTSGQSKKVAEDDRSRVSRWRSGADLTIESGM